MHISVDQVGEVARRENARVERYLSRLDLTQPVTKIARLLVERGIVRAAMSSDELQKRLVAAVATTNRFTGTGWVQAARKVVSGWVPSKWTQTETQNEGGVHVHVFVCTGGPHLKEEKT